VLDFFLVLLLIFLSAASVLARPDIVVINKALGASAHAHHGSEDDF
jgi:hypothetical protein